MTPGQTEQFNQELQQRRERIVRALLVALVILGVFAYVPSVWLGIRVGAWGIVALDTVVYLLLLLMVAFGAGRTRLQSGFMVAVSYTLALVLSVVLGPTGAGPIWLAAVAPVTAVLFGRTATYGALALTLATAAGIGVAAWAGLIQWDDGGNTTALWLVMAGNAVLVGGGLALMVSSLFGGLRTTALKNASVTAELDRERMRLLETNRRLQEEAAERRQAEEQLRQAEKLSAIGTLATGIAHDFNNLLTPILTAPELLRDPSVPSDDRDRILDQVEEAAHAGRELVHRILAFSRPTGEGRTPLKARAAFKDAIRLLRASLPASVSLEVELDSDAGHVLLKPAEVHQIVLNLGSNAQKAMPEGGLLSFRLTEVDGDDVLPADHRAERAIRLRVSDTGVGMDPEVARRIFDPFFTTDDEVGTGMGLATVHGIVHSAGGSIRSQSEPGEGTTMLVHLPVVDADAEPAAVGRAPDDHVGEGRHVLLVEDEEPVRDVSTRALRRMGFAVTAVPDARAALESLAESPAIDTVVTDLNMPGMKGTRLAREIKARHADIGIILMTGLVDEDLEGEAREIGIDRILAKPFRVDELAAALQAV